MRKITNWFRHTALATCAAIVMTLTTNPASAAPEKIGVDLRSTQWGMNAVRAEAAWKYSKGAGVIVAVIDTGVDGTHPDLIGRVLPGWSTLSKSALPADQDNDSDEHGTHVAAIIAGDDDSDGVAGVAPESKILPVQVLGSNGGTDRTVADGINWAVANGAKVINLSLGGQKSIFDSGGNISCDAVGKAFDAGVVVIVAAGNSGSRNNPENRPASCRGALSVAALDENLDRAFFSSYDATVGISAPGRRIVSAIPTQATFPYAQWDGTSMAAPFVAGVAALLRAAHPEWTAEQIVERIKETAVDVNAPGVDPETGAGSVDAAAALGATAIKITTLRESIREITAPNITGASSDGYETTVTWESPYGATVDKYIIRYQEELSSEPKIVTVSGDKLSGIIPINAFTGGFISVLAHVGNSTRTSLMTDRVSLDLKPEKPVARPKLSKLKARWVASGIEVTFTTSGVAGKINVTAIDWNYGLIQDIYVDVPKSQKGIETKTIVKVESDSEARAHVAIVLAGTEGKREQIDLLPQYPLSGLVLTAGDSKVAVKGSASFSCIANNIACQGTIISVIDVKSRKTLATSRVLASAEYVIVFDRSKLTGTQVQLSLDGKISSPKLTVPVKPTPKPTPSASSTPTPKPSASEPINAKTKKGLIR